MPSIFSIIASAINIYALVVLVRVLLTWFPKANFSPAGRFLSTVCDPFLNFFRRLRFLNFNGLDFSPAVAICVLYALATLFSSLSHGQQLSVGYFLAVILSLAWSLCSSIIKFIIALLIIRLVVFLFMQYSAKGSYQTHSTIWDSIDRIITPYIYKITGLFSKKIISFTKALLISIIFSIVAVKLADFAVRLVSGLLLALPF